MDIRKSLYYRRGGINRKKNCRGLKSEKFTMGITIWWISLNSKFSKYIYKKIPAMNINEK